MNLGIFLKSRQLNARSPLTGSIRLTVFIMGVVISLGPFWAQADDAVPYGLNTPATLTQRARFGLFTSITRAGDHLVAVGERGRIMLSDDSGISWQQVTTPTSVTLTSVRFATADQGWAVGQMGMVLHTSDGGKTWIKQLDGIKACDIMLAAAKQDIAAQGTNATTTASLQAAQQTVSGGPSVPFLTVLPISMKQLVIGGGFGLAFSSMDGGNNWQSIADKIPNPDGLHIYALAHLDTTVIAVGEQGLILKQEGNSPYSMITTADQGSLFGVLVTPHQTILAFGLQGVILRSVDQGQHWSDPSSEVDTGIDCGVVLADGTIVLGDVAGDLLTSRDDGQTFTASEVGEPVAGIAQASDGSLIIGGPLGLRRISAKALAPGA